MNQHLNFSLSRTSDLKIFNKKLGIDIEVSLFVYFDENTMMTYRIIGNRAPAGYFLPELKNIYFLLHIQGDLVPGDIQELIRKLNEINPVRMCVPVDLSKIRDKDLLQLW